MEIAPKKRAELVFSHLRQQVSPVEGGELSGEQKLWLSVIERALFDLATPPPVPAFNPAEFLTTSETVSLLGIDHSWVARLLQRYGLV